MLLPDAASEFIPSENCSPEEVFLIVGQELGCFGIFTLFEQLFVERLNHREFTLSFCQEVVAGRFGELAALSPTYCSKTVWFAEMPECGIVAFAQLTAYFEKFRHVG